MFTVRKRPQSGESLTSYMQRLCYENPLNPMDLWVSILVKKRNHKYQSAESFSIDHIPTKSLNIGLFAKLLRLDIEALEKLTFIPLIKKLIRETSNHELYKTRILAGQISKARRFCPLCVKEKGYYQLLWQVNETEACLEHETKLLNKCPECGNSIPCLYPWAQIGFCKCGQNLALSGSKESAFLDMDIKYQERIIQDWRTLLSDSLYPVFIKEDPKVDTALALLYVMSILQN